MRFPCHPQLVDTMSGAVIRRAARPSDNFAQISNATLADERLSWKAVGLLAYLLSRPIGWGTTAHDLWKSRTHKGEGRDVIYAALKELESYGYLRRTRVRDADGTFSWEQEVYDTPVDNRGERPISWVPGDGPLPDDQEPADQEPVSQESSTKKETKKETKKTTRGESVSSSPSYPQGEAVTSPARVLALPPSRPLPRPDHCVDHQDDPNPPPCPACAEARRTMQYVQADMATRPCTPHGYVGKCPYCPGGKFYSLEEVS